VYSCTEYVAKCLLVKFEIGVMMWFMISYIRVSEKMIAFFCDVAVAHRIDGPAIMYSNGNMIWSFKGSQHRVDGPAVEWKTGSEKEWRIHGKLIRSEKTC